MKDLKIGDKFFFNRMGYSKDPKGDDLYGKMGYIIITVAKVNPKSFRTDYDDELLKERPNGWYSYDEELLHRFTLSRIASMIMREGTYSGIDRVRAKDSFNMLNDDDKSIVFEKLQDKAEEERVLVLNRYRDRLTDKHYEDGKYRY